MFIFVEDNGQAVGVRFNDGYVLLALVALRGIYNEILIN